MRIIACCLTCALGVTLGQDLPPEVTDIIYAVRPYGPDGHYYANFGSYCDDPGKKAYPIGGQLRRLDVKTGEARVLLDDVHGGVRDPQLHYDGRTILFSYRPGGTEHYHLYTIGADGTGLRQLTDGPFDDIEPTFLPDGGIAFCSSRCNRWVACWKTPVAILYRCDADGGRIRPLSSNAVTENTPAVLPDGRLLYTRWEYVNRSQLAYHHLWTVNPDGTGQMTYFGNMHPTGKPHALRDQSDTEVFYENVPGDVAMLDAKPLPDTQQVVAVFSPGHGRREHEGFLTVVDPNHGPDHLPFARRLHPAGNWRDPWPLTPELILAASGRDLQLVNLQGKTRTIHTLDHPDPHMRLHEPVPLRPRTQEQVIPDRTDRTDPVGRLILSNAVIGRNMDGLRPGDIRKLLVLEQLPVPFHNSPGFDGISLWGSFTLTRILGTVPVEEDGSAHFEAPAMRSLHFVALDENDLGVKKMQSFVTLQPGETTSCVGCHEHRTTAPPDSGRPSLISMCRPPSRIEPIPDMPQIVDFRRHIQPLLDRHCTSCHGPERQDADLNLAGAGSAPSHGAGRVALSYIQLVRRRDEIADGRNAHGNRAPRTIGSSASKFLRRFDPSHFKVQATPEERTIVRLWLDSGAVANGTYAIMNGGTPEHPSPLYVREMRRYGLWPVEHESQNSPVDVYAMDEAYWRSFWYLPE